MIPHTKDHSPNSLPVSRVALGTRLNLLSAPNMLKSLSRPSTPGAYVASSLNPSKNPPITLTGLVAGAAEQDAKYESLLLLENIGKFEAVLGALSQSVSSFEGDQLVGTVQKLIDINDEISTGLQQLEEHRRLGEQAEALIKTNKDLELQSKHILRELIAYRAQLKQLSSLPASKDQTSQTLRSVDVQTLIEYSMKLAKFSKAPATVQSPFIHPNNFVWPAEDALRRGMLAMASLKPEELIKAELGVQDVGKLNSSDDDVEMEDVQEAPKAESEPRVEPSRPLAKPAAQSRPAASLDLDLFDSDQDDSD